MSKERAPEIEKNKFILEQLSEAEQDILIEEAREKKRRDESARLKSATRKGIVEGEEKKAKEIAKELIALEMDIDKISKITGLTEAQIEKLKDSK